MGRLKKLSRINLNEELEFRENISIISGPHGKEVFGEQQQELIEEEEGKCIANNGLRKGYAMGRNDQWDIEYRIMMKGIDGGAGAGRICTIISRMVYNYEKIFVAIIYIHIYS
ncbi:MAG: hypothetical protein QW292_07600 [Candidatus Parvarchaeota archaeon]